MMAATSAFYYPKIGIYIRLCKQQTQDLQCKHILMQKKPHKPRKASISSNKSFHSVDQLRLSSPFESYGRTNRFPWKPFINFMFIMLATIQVYLLVNSRIYLRGELVRTFLSIYIDEQTYPDLFDGKQFYLQITNVKELRDHFDYMFKRINVIEDDSFVDYNFQNARFILHTEYKQFAGSQKRETVHIIDPEVGIIKPFNMSNITDIQLYLIQTQSFELHIENLTMRQNWEGFTQKYTHEIVYAFVDNIKVQINFNFKISNAMMNNVDGNDHEGDIERRQRMDKLGRSDEQHMSMVDCIKQNCYYRRNIKSFEELQQYKYDQRKNDDPTHTNPNHINTKGQNKNNDDAVLKEVPFQTTYIIRIRTFYGLVFLVACISLYLNYVQIRRTYKILYDELSILEKEQENNEEAHPLNEILMTKEEEDDIKQKVRKWVQLNRMTITDLKFEHYFHILDFDVIFSTLSNIFEIIAAFYLVSGIEKERIAGIACLFSWLTIFKFVRDNKKLVLMYELIKLSIAKVVKFFVQFLPVFLSYALLGTCLFTKVSFYSSLANSVTTLVCLMMGDSIQMITDAMIQKNSVIIVIIYIFSFVLLFMHGIHNTLTSLIKEFFIIKKIELVKWEKQQAKQTDYIYIQEMRTQSDQEKQKLPLKLTSDLMKQLLRIKALGRTKQYEQSGNFLCHALQNIRIKQKWMIKQHRLGRFPQVKQELIRRSMALSRIVKEYDIQSTRRKKSGASLLLSNRQQNRAARDENDEDIDLNKESLLSSNMD